MEPGAWSGHAPGLNFEGRTNMQERFEEFETWPSADEEVAFAQALVEEFDRIYDGAVFIPDVETIRCLRRIFADFGRRIRRESPEALLRVEQEELPDVVQLTVNAPRLRITDTGHFAKLMLCDALEFLAARDGLLRVRMSVDGVWAD